MSVPMVEMPTGMAATMARIREIQSRVGAGLPASGTAGTSSASTLTSYAGSAGSSAATSVSASYAGTSLAANAGSSLGGYTASAYADALGSSGGAGAGSLAGVAGAQSGQFAAALQSATTAGASGAGGGVAGRGGSAPTGADVVADARRYLGVPYVWGGTDPARGLDCSALVQRVYADLGVSLPRVSRDQARAGIAVPDLASARPGDILAFGAPVDHVGIYVGGGQMLEAPRPGKSVRIAPLSGEPVAIRRILAPAETPASVGAAPVTVGSAAPAVTAGAGGQVGGVDRYAALFAAAERAHGLPTGLLRAVAAVESGGRADAVSPAGARGLMQLMPATARQLGVDPMDPAAAVDGAARLLASHLRSYGGSLPLALAAYNAGPAAVARYGGQVPPFAETQGYVRKVLSTMGAAA